ncbi:MAG TPA: proton-conducting transporter membrane subunit [Xanthobacteraceae bacterium]|nr:proton-conducting transporter membrane subunit [Xanthobacteraceae bacterium]
MPYSAPVLDTAATTDGFLLVLSLVVPIAGVLLAFVAGGRRGERIAFATMPLGFAIAIAILFALRRTGGPLVYLLGGWAPPLGVALRADGLSAVMMMTTAAVICAVGVYAYADFRTPAGQTRAPSAFWMLLLAVWSALNTVFLGGDLFTLYVALELLTFAAVPLVCLDGRAETLQAALRYLLFALFGSALYLVGTALLYGAYGTLDMVLLSHRIRVEPATLVAAALMTVGLLAKTALFPLHLWLPPAHAGAPAAASAVLSALVVKGSFFIVVRLWFDVMPGLVIRGGAQLLAVLGAAAIVFGSVIALRQQRLKLLIAYSTLAQIGYLFLMFPLAFGGGAPPLQSGALTGGLVQTISHATAKAAMFMAAGLIYAALGHDRITRLNGVGRALPMSVLAFGLSGVALIGLPPSGVYLAKSLLLQAAAETEQWWWTVVIQAGAFFTSGYVVLVLVQALAPADEPVTLRVPVSRVGETTALALAICSLLLGLFPWGAYLSVPAGSPSPSDMLSLKAALSMLWPIVGGGVLAVLLGRWGDRLTRIRFGKFLVAIVGPARHAALGLGGTIEAIDGVLRQWPAAALAVLVLAILFGAALLT